MIDKKLEADFMDKTAPSMKQAYTKLVTESGAQSKARFAQIRETELAIFHYDRDGLWILAFFVGDFWLDAFANFS